jgi:hypothetical protein
MKPPPPIFLARQGYRQRRATDAARFLPVVGAFLLLVPLLWTGGSTRSGVIYIFAIWFLLILVAGLLSRWLSAPELDQQSTPDERAD